MNLDPDRGLDDARRIATAIVGREAVSVRVMSPNGNAAIVEAGTVGSGCDVGP